MLSISKAYPGLEAMANPSPQLKALFESWKLPDLPPHVSEVTEMVKQLSELPQVKAVTERARQAAEAVKGATPLVAVSEKPIGQWTMEELRRSIEKDQAEVERLVASIDRKRREAASRD
jgi:hypothetical protein